MDKPVKFAVILSGCGVYDGSEIHETTLTLYAIKKNGCEYDIFAPDIEQHHVVNHITGEEMAEKRNVLVESARIARGKIKPLHEFDSNEFDSIIFPGGFGAAKNLSDYAVKGADLTVNEDVQKAVKAMSQTGKPIGALCISPVVIAKILDNIEVTIGQDKATIANIESIGAQHVITNHGEVVVDKINKVVTTPCYMLDATITQIAEGTENVVRAILKLLE